MTVLSLTTLAIKPDPYEEFLATTKKSKSILEKCGAKNVRLIVGMRGQQSASFVLTHEADDFTDAARITDKFLADPEGLAAMMESGTTEVSALIDRNEPFDQLLRTINRLLQPGSPPQTARRTSGSLASMRATDRRQGPRLHLFDILTEREQVVLAELMEGHRAEEIATAAFVSISTVRSQIKAILQKLGVNSQLAAVAMARRGGWSLNPPPPGGGTLPTRWDESRAPGG